MADPRLTVVKMLMKMDSSEAYSNLLLDKSFSIVCNTGKTRS